MYICNRHYFRSHSEYVCTYVLLCTYVSKYILESGNNVANTKWAEKNESRT